MPKTPAGKSSERKRLRQTSIESCFRLNKKQKSSETTDQDKSVDQEVLEWMEVPDMSTHHTTEAGGVAGSQQKRNVLAAAAEKRRNSESPTSCPDNEPSSSHQKVDKPKKQQFVDLPSCSTSSPPQYRPNGSKPGASHSTAPPKSGPSSHDTLSIKPRTSTVPADRTTTGQAESNPNSVFAYLEGINSIECRTGAGASIRTPTVAPGVTYSDDTPSTSRGGGSIQRASGAEARTASSKGVTKDDSDVIDLSQDELSETLEYDASQPLFTDSEPSSQEVPLDDIPQSLEGEQRYWKGTPMHQLNQAPACRAQLPVLVPHQSHTVLFRPYFRPGDPPRPYPDQYHDIWDAYHVRMPCSPENLYPVEDKAGQKTVQSRWEIIETTLLNDINNSYELEDAILTYNARYSKKWDFRALHHFFTEFLDDTESEHFFSSVLPGMVQLALQLPKLCTKAIPLLKRQQNGSISLTQQQAASLLANAFFCTYPRRNAQQKKSEYSTFPDINFNRIFEGTSPRKTAKIQCIVNYFRRVVAHIPAGTLTFTRRALRKLPRWDTSTAKLTKLHTTASGMIEDEGSGMLQMDFANKFIGGGVLGHGCVQEEIRFLICPELILSRLFTEFMDENECLIIQGAERFSNYSGYANTFQWTGNFQDNTPRDTWGRMETEIVAIDALVIRNYADQFKPELIRRELNKAFCGFHGGGATPQHMPALATGNWGCGAFGGDKRVKGLLQMMAAAQCHRQVCYFTFGDKTLCDDLSNMHEFLVSSGITVGSLWGTLQKYRKDVICNKSAKGSPPRLFPYLYQIYSDYQSSTEDEGDVKSVAESISPVYQDDTP